MCSDVLVLVRVHAAALSIGRGSQWGCSHLEIRLGRSGYHQHSSDRQFCSSSLSDLVEHIQAKQERCKN